MEWRPQSNLTIAASWLHGSSFGLRLSSKLDTKSTPKTEKRAGVLQCIRTRSLSGAPENLNLSSWYDRLLYDAERSGLRLNKAAIDSETVEVTLEIENAGYALTADAVHKVLSLSEVHLSRKIKSVKWRCVKQDQRADHKI